MIAEIPIPEQTLMTAASEPPCSGSAETGTSHKPSSNPPANWWGRKSLVIAMLAISAIVGHLVLRFGVQTSVVVSNVPLLETLVIGGLPKLYDLLRKLMKREFGSGFWGKCEHYSGIVFSVSGT